MVRFGILVLLFVMIKYSYNIEITQLSILQLTASILQVECQFNESTTDIGWSFYNSSSNTSTELSNGPETLIDHDPLRSTLLISSPFSKNLLGLYAVCRVSLTGHATAFASLRIDIEHTTLEPTTIARTTSLPATTLAAETTHSPTTRRPTSAHTTPTDQPSTVSTTSSGQSTAQNGVTSSPTEPITNTDETTDQSPVQHGVTSTYTVTSEPITTTVEPTGSSADGIGATTVSATSPATSDQSATTHSTPTGQSAASAHTSIATPTEQTPTPQANVGNTATQGIPSPVSKTTFSTASVPTVTPTWCTLGDVNDLQKAIACGETTGIDVEPGTLNDAKRAELVNFLQFIATQPAEQLTASDTIAVTKVVLMVFTKLTDPDQNLSVQAEATVVADSEAALEMLAGTLLPMTCAAVAYQASSANLCNSLTADQLDDHSFAHEVPRSYDADGNVIATFAESVEFDLSELDQDAQNVSVVVLRKAGVAQRIHYVKYLEQTDNLLAPSETWIQQNSDLLIISVFVNGSRASVPITFTIFHLENVTDESVNVGRATVKISKNSICGFVDDRDDQDVQWSVWGCDVILDKSTGEYTFCSCNHSTNFAVLMQVNSYEISSANSLALSWITYIGCGTSMIMLLLMLAVFMYIRQMLQSGRSFIHANLAVAILLAQILFIAGIDRTENRGVCKAIALLLHFCYLSVFAWMLVEGIHLYLKIIKVYGSENIKMYPYLLVGWGIPTIITLISFGANNEGYGTGTSCWLDTSTGLIWAFVAPALLVIVINMIVLAMVVRIIIKSTQLRQDNKFDHIKAGIKGALVLLPILGLTWVFGLLAVNSALIVFQYLFTIFNSFQGVFIFLINCVFNSEVKAALVRKREKRRLAKESKTLENSVCLAYTTKQNTSAANTSNSRGRSNYNNQEQDTDLTSLRSVSPSSRPGSSSTLLDVTQRKHPTRPHSGKVSPMPITEEVGTI